MTKAAKSTIATIRIVTLFPMRGSGGEGSAQGSSSILARPIVKTIRRYRVSGSRRFQPTATSPGWDNVPPPASVDIAIRRSNFSVVIIDFPEEPSQDLTQSHGFCLAVQVINIQPASLVTEDFPDIALLPWKPSGQFTPSELR